VEKRDVQIPSKSPKLWTDEYDDIIQSFVEMSKYAAIFDPYTFNAIELPLLKNYLNPQAPTLERQKQIMHGTNGAIMTLKNYPNQYVEKILANKVPQNFVNSETKIGIYASYLNPNLFVSHLGQIGPGEEGRSLLLEKCQSDLKQYMNDNGVDKQSRQKVYRSMLINLMNFLPQVLNELKNLGIIHFDIKNENILICNGSLKLGDFGAAKLLSEKLNMRGTIGFESPLQKRGIFDPNADKYAAGKTILEFLYYVSSSKYAQSDPYHENHFKDPLSLPFEDESITF
jgi:serine/threonine protein kinase